MSCPAVDSWKSVGALRWKADSTAHRNQFDKCPRERLVDKTPTQTPETKQQKQKVKGIGSAQLYNSFTN